MRLSVFIPGTSQQLFTDLKKLYQGYLCENALSAEAFTSRINNPTSVFFVTMFNARHIGAVEVIIESNKAQLIDLCIRDITRRRGVGRNLLREVEKHLSDKGIKTTMLALTNIKEEEQIGVAEFMKNCGYQLIDSHFMKKL